jgi:hypothetical protein
MGRASKRRGQLRALGVTLVAALLLANACGGSSGSKKAKSAPKKEVFTEPISTANNPFTPPAGADQTVPPVQPQGVSTQPGGQPGLFGGTMQQGSCNKEQLITFLEQNPDKGQAWASTLGINFADLRTYVTGLTPVLLRSDTRVTNHGWKNGKITAIQVVLQAGTAVLVDEKGFPVVKCYCGNPLTPPEAYPPTYSGPKWDYFNPESLTVIEKNITIIDIFVLIDPRTGQSFLRPRSTDGSQDTSAAAPPTTTSPPITPRTSPPTTYPPTTPPTTHYTPPTTQYTPPTTQHTPSST